MFGHKMEALIRVASLLNYNLPKCVMKNREPLEFKGKQRADWAFMIFTCRGISLLSDWPSFTLLASVEN